jgi:flagellar motor component MotA
MTHDEVIAAYRQFAPVAVKVNDTARREGLLALEDDLMKNKIDMSDVVYYGLRLVIDNMKHDDDIDARDVFYYGLRLVIDCPDPAMIDPILSNLVAQAADENERRFKTIQKAAVLSIQACENPRVMVLRLNSYTDLRLSEDPCCTWIKDMFMEEDKNDA